MAGGGVGVGGSVGIGSGVNVATGDATVVWVGDDVAVLVGETAVAVSVTTTGRVTSTVSAGGVQAARISKNSKQIVNHFDVAFMKRSNAVRGTAVFPQVISLYCGKKWVARLDEG